MCAQTYPSQPAHTQSVESVFHHHTIPRKDRRQLLHGKSHRHTVNTHISQGPPGIRNLHGHSQIKKSKRAGIPERHKLPVKQSRGEGHCHSGGNLAIEEKVNISEAEARQKAGVMQGGFSSPKHCVARWSLAVIVPYRNRETQIGAFLNHMHPFLQRQQLNYSIYFVEQEGSAPFNRASLLNVGFKEARKEGPWDCYAFHDVDLLPENDFHLYHCSPQPRHLAVARSTFNYRNLAVALRP
ncbi:beta-1,4-galactosyltransferase 4-like [Procambarus clarkii]|uniref:beta-1,4-galactosyltransferase 4-like n=1 Tax=Procambarus clarkii TaxID=6728 RepID=UPI003742711A